MSPHKVDRARVKKLTDLPNVGKATAGICACSAFTRLSNSPVNARLKCTNAFAEKPGIVTIPASLMFSCPSHTF